MERSLRVSALLAFVFACTLMCPAQTGASALAPADGSTRLSVDDSVVPLYGPWKFQVGDSPTDAKTGEPLWAQPGFDDSKWETVDLTPHAGVVDPFTNDPRYVKGWTTKGHPGYWGYAWYRIRLPVTSAPRELALLTYGWMDDGYQLFGNGRLLGSWGKFSGPGKWPVVYFTQPAMFVLPRVSASGNSTAGSAQQTLAFRVWMGPVRLSEHPFTGGFHYAPLLGEAGAIATRSELEWMELVRSHISSAVAGGLFLLLAILAASLTLFDRSDSVYLWVAGALLLMGIDEIFFMAANWTQWESLRTFFIQLVFTFPLMFGAWAMVWWIWFKLRRPQWIPKAIVAITVIDMIALLLAGELLPGTISHPVGLSFRVISMVARLLLLGIVLFIIFKAIRDQGWEGWLVLPAVVLLAFAQFQGDLIKVQWHGTFSAYGIVFFYSEAANLLLAAAVALLLLRRLLASVRSQRQMALDVKQAQEVQQVIVPVARTALPGFVIESEYRPAREVGGDFFQLIPGESDGSLLIVAGDVTGKGLKAGMLVALLVGAIRTAARFNPDPVAVLLELNERLLGRSDAQATCLALRIDADGGVTLANAGHLAPYLNGEPVAMEGALPLGMIDHAEPSVTRFKLEEGDRLVLMSDGVAEAMDADGTLFGFERIHDVLQTATTAAEIASAAQAYGQEDDISVISLTWSPVREHAGAIQGLARVSQDGGAAVSSAVTT